MSRHLDGRSHPLFSQRLVDDFEEVLRLHTGLEGVKSALDPSLGDAAV